MNESKDRLYDLLPVVHRKRDAERGYPLRALLQVIAEQVNIVEQDIAQLYENWFIETCEEWAVPYIGELIGFQPVHEAGDTGDVATREGQLRNKFLVPRREVANTIRNRRRRGTLALLELMAADVAGWPSRAVEFYKLLGVAQNINLLHLNRGRTVDLRRGEALERLNGPFDKIAHTVDVRRISSHRTAGRYNIPSVGLFVWRLRSYSVTDAPAYCYQEGGPHRYTFSVLGNNSPLYVRPVREQEPTQIAGELNVPTAIRRRSFEECISDYYGAGKSIEIWIDKKIWKDETRHPLFPDRYLVPTKKIIAADLSNWTYEPPRNRVAVDPVLGRIAFHPDQVQDLDEPNLWVTYNYGFSDDMGAGEYTRTLLQPGDCEVISSPEYDKKVALEKSDGQNETRHEDLCILYRVGQKADFSTIGEALKKWKEHKPRHAIIELQDSHAYVEQPNIHLGKRQTLQLRAASGVRPVLFVLNNYTSRAEYLRVSGDEGSRFTFDGLVLTGRGIYVTGAIDEVVIRHSTLVPGWSLGEDCRPAHSTKPSLEIKDTKARITVKRSIIGSIQVSQDEVKQDPIHIRISDSILDATDSDEEAVGAPGNRYAHAVLTVLRSTVFGVIQTHAIELAENSIFDGLIRVARRQLGCVRFCYVTPGSRTPRRYNCQPDLIEQGVESQFKAGDITAVERVSALARERLRVRPQFNSTLYGTPTYCQLAESCAKEITRGADDESEMGAFHDLFQPQRAANLRARLDQFTPAGMDAGIIYAS